MLLSELLDTPGLRLRVLHAEPGALDQPVGRVVTTDLLEPGRYLSGGELVLTGLVWRRSADDSETFVRSVAGRGATTILAGEAQLGTVPPDLLNACRTHGVTLIEVPTEVAFADVTEHVAASGAASGARLSASLARQRQLLSAIVSGRSLDELAARVSAEVGHDCRVITPTGRHVVPGPGELDEATLGAVTKRFLTADRLPVVADTGGTAYSLFPVGSGLDSRLTAWLLVADGDHTQWPRDHVEALHELCAIAALDRSRRDEGLRALRPIAADALALAESGAPHAEVSARLRQAGLPSDRRLVAAVAELGEDGPSEGAVRLLEDVALAVGPPVGAARAAPHGAGPARPRHRPGHLRRRPERRDRRGRPVRRPGGGAVRAPGGARGERAGVGGRLGPGHLARTVAGLGPRRRPADVRAPGARAGSRAGPPLPR